MSISLVRKNKKQVLETVFFLAAMGLTFYAVFHGQNITQIWDAMGRLSIYGFCLAIMTAIFYVSAEGCMICYLLRSLNRKCSLLRCISYSFIGFFYSGITPSATGGQPMQLYYMKKDGNPLSDSSVVLMTVALIYKFVLVLIGIFMLVFWQNPLRFYLQGYYALFLLGLALNTLLVGVLIVVMLAPKGMKNIISGVENLFEKIKVLKPSVERKDKINQFIDGYQGAVHFLLEHKRKVFVVVIFTFVQRFSVFFLTYVIYRGFALQGTSLITILFLQASVYIAVDMLPIPGAQGITELMYHKVFEKIFTGAYLTPSLYVMRGISFYFLLIISLFVIAGNHIYGKSHYRKK